MATRRDGSTTGDPPAGRASDVLRAAGTADDGGGGALDVERLITEHHAVVYRYAFRLTGCAADAEDLCQQTFLTAQQKLSQLRCAAAARSWLFTVLRRHYLRLVRQHGAPTAPLEDVDLSQLAAPIPPQVWIDEEDLQTALDALPAEFKLVLVMFYFEECSYREMAAQLEIPIGTVMSRLARAKQHLRARLSVPAPRRTLETS